MLELTVAIDVMLVFRVVAMLFRQDIGQDFPEPRGDHRVALASELFYAVQCLHERLLNDVRKIEFRRETTIPRGARKKTRVRTEPLQITFGSRHRTCSMELSNLVSGLEGG